MGNITTKQQMKNKNIYSIRGKCKQQQKLIQQQQQENSSLTCNETTEQEEIDIQAQRELQNYLSQIQIEKINQINKLEKERQNLTTFKQQKEVEDKILNLRQQIQKNILECKEHKMKASKSSIIKQLGQKKMEHQNNNGSSQYDLLQKYVLGEKRQYSYNDEQENQQDYETNENIQVMNQDQLFQQQINRAEILEIQNSNEQLNESPEFMSQEMETQIQNQNNELEEKYLQIENKLNTINEEEEDIRSLNAVTQNGSNFKNQYQGSDQKFNEISYQNYAKNDRASPKSQNQQPSLLQSEIKKAKDISCDFNESQIPEIQQPYFFSLANQQQIPQEDQQRKQFEEQMIELDTILEENNALEILEQKDIMINQSEIDLNNPDEVQKQLAIVEQKLGYTYKVWNYIENGIQIFLADEEELAQFQEMDSFLNIYGIHMNPIQFDYMKEFFENTFQCVRGLRVFSFHIGDMYESEITDSQFNLFCTFLEKMVHLRSLKIFSNQMNGYRFQQLCTEGLSNLYQIRNLDLDFNGVTIDNTFFESLIKNVLPKMNQLRHLGLNLMATELTKESILLFGEQCFPLLTNLKSIYLDFRQNGIEQSVLIQLFGDYLRLNTLSLISCVAYIGVGNYVNEKTVETIKDHLHQINTLKHCYVE